MTELLLEVVPWALTGTLREQRLYVATLVVLLLGTGAGLLALAFPRLDVPAAALSGAGAVGWLLANGAGEGPTLAVVSPGNGVTASDLVAVPAGLIVLALVWRRLVAGHP